MGRLVRRVSSDRPTHRRIRAPTLAPTTAVRFALRLLRNYKSTSARRIDPPCLVTATARWVCATLRRGRTGASGLIRLRASHAIRSSPGPTILRATRTPSTIRASRRCGVICARRKRPSRAMTRSPGTCALSTRTWIGRESNDAEEGTEPLRQLCCCYQLLQLGFCLPAAVLLGGGDSSRRRHHQTELGSDRHPTIRDHDWLPYMELAPHLRRRR